LQVNSALTSSNVTVQANTQKLFQLNSEIDFGINQKPEYERIDSVIFNTVNFTIDLKDFEIRPEDIDSIIISQKKYLNHWFTEKMIL
jgi:hypothetical protein